MNRALVVVALLSWVGCSSSPSGSSSSSLASSATSGPGTTNTTSSGSSTTVTAASTATATNGSTTGKASSSQGPTGSTAASTSQSVSGPSTAGPSTTGSSAASSKGSTGRSSGGSTGAHCTATSPAGQACGLPGGITGECCGSECVNTAVDRNHCGSCANSCARNDLCESSKCVGPPTCADAGDGSACNLPNQVNGLCCGGSCVDPSSDRSHCGTCADACSSGDTCVNSKCQTTPPCVDAGDQTPCELPNATLGACCSNSCVDTSSDRQNCGFCGFGCNAGQDCVSGSCVGHCAADAGLGSNCEGPDGGVFMCCSAGCTDSSSDTKNCGTCGVVCGAGQVCAFGNCALPSCSAAKSGGQACATLGGVGTCCEGACVDLFSSSTDCGTCGNACPNASTLCDPNSGCIGQSGGPSTCKATTDCPTGHTCLTSAGACVLTRCTAADETSVCSLNGQLGYCCSSTCQATACGS